MTAQVDFLWSQNSKNFRVKDGLLRNFYVERKVDGCNIAYYNVGKFAADTVGYNAVLVYINKKTYTDLFRYDNIIDRMTKRYSFKFNRRPENRKIVLAYRNNLPAEDVFEFDMQESGYGSMTCLFKNNADLPLIIGLMTDLITMAESKRFKKTAADAEELLEDYLTDAERCWLKIDYLSLDNNRI